MNIIELAKCVSRGAFAKGFLTIFTILFLPLVSGAQETIRIYAAKQWTVVGATVNIIPSTSPKWDKRAFMMVVAEPVYYYAMKPTTGDRIDLVVLTRNQWFKSLNEGSAIAAIAEMGPYVTAVNEDVFREKKNKIAEFLETWQGAWGRSGYPYGVQPPEVDFLKNKYGEFLKQHGAIKPKDIAQLTKVVIKYRPVKFSPGEALMMDKEYYASLGLNVRSSTNAKQGETNEGRVMDEFSTYLKLDKNPCECELVNVEQPYDRKKMGKTKTCEGKAWEIYQVTKK